MSEEGELFHGELFPCSYFLIYCPFPSCTLERPFKEPQELLEHMDKHHGTKIHCENAVLPFLDRYLKVLTEQTAFDQDDHKMLGGTDEDRELRERLQQQVLQEMLDLQERERKSLYEKPRQCLFCLEFSSSLREMFTHMYKDHEFNIGLLDNLVMVDEFLKTLDTILMRNICIYCHNVFRTAGCLRKHMKNKRHYKIDPKNHHYDRYYIVNYVKNASMETVERECKEEEESDWDDLVEEVDHRTNCLFCQQVLLSPGKELSDHLLSTHDFDLEAVRRTFHQQDQFYDYIKMITYLRSQVCNLTCPTCSKEFDEQEVLEEHMATEKHCNVPPKHLWDQPQYLFPIFDDDPLLFYFGEELDE